MNIVLWVILVHVIEVIGIAGYLIIRKNNVILPGMTQFCNTNNGFRLIKILYLISENVSLSIQLSYFISDLNAL